MADRKTGITDEINIIRESDSKDLTSELGIIQSAQWTIDIPEELRSSVGNTPDLQAAIQQVAGVDLTLTVELPDLSALKLVGTYTDNGDGTYSFSFDDKLPSFTAKITVTENDDNLELTGIKFLTAEITVQEGSPVQIQFSGEGLDADFIDEKISTPDPESPSQFLDAFLKLGGSNVGSVDSATITYDRDNGPDSGSQRGLSSELAGDPTPDQIIEGNKFYSLSSTVEITDAQAFEETFNSSSQPFGLSDATQRTSATLVLNDGDDNFELGDAKINNNSGQVTDEAGEIRTVDIQANALSATVEGST